MYPRGSVALSVFDLTAINNYRASSESVHAAQFSARDARDAVVLAVCGSYLQIVATHERVIFAHAQESLTSAELDQINSIFAHNLAKLTLARAIASAADNLQQFLSIE
jgi:outer membrane protein TolC